MEEKIIWKGRKSRKVFLHYYFFGILLIIFGLFSSIGLINSFLPFLAVLSDYLSYFLVGIGLVLFVISEVKRVLVKYSITETRIIKESGIINKFIDYIPYQMIERISLHNMWYERLLKIGDIKIDTGEENLLIESVDHPEKLEKIIRDIINKITGGYYTKPKEYKKYNRVAK